MASSDKHSQQPAVNLKSGVCDKGLILIGCGGHARACIDVIEQEGVHKIGGLVGAFDQMGTSQSGYAVLGVDDDLERLAKMFRYALVGVGQIKTPDVRMRLFSRAIDSGFEIPVIASPNAYVSKSAEIGRGTIVMHGAVVNANATIGQNCIINSRALVEHDVTVEDGCHISTGAILNGAVRVGYGSFVGSGSIVKQGVAIGRRSVVGMHCAVFEDVSDDTTIKG